MLSIIFLQFFDKLSFNQLAGAAIRQVLPVIRGRDILHGQCGVAQLLRQSQLLGPGQPDARSLPGRLALQHARNLIHRETS